MNRIVEKNLELMVGEHPNNMHYFLMSESIAGNAGRWKGMECGAANFFYEPLTGEIQYFANSQHADDSEALEEATFRIAVKLGDGLKKPTKYRIITCRVPLDIKEKAKQNIAETVWEYNKRYGFSL